MSEVKISPGNSKLGSIPSVSLPSVVTCIQCGCQEKCYARRIENLRPNVAKAYATNYELLQTKSDVYWREVEASIMMSRFFRFHVSGDIVDSEYFTQMVRIAERNPHCEVLCFTKKYKIINDYISQEWVLPKNLHIVFSAWVGLEMVNPFSLPEAHVRYRDGTTTARDDAKECSGNCSECAITDGGCWSLKNGEQVVFNEH